jgi:nitrous oxide reductase accessory protein NosL
VRNLVATTLLTILGVTTLPGCGDAASSAAAPPPRELTGEATGYYCHMIVQDHPGPKGQIFVAGTPEPIWFSSVRDTLAFTMLPEEPKNLAAIYVSDMARADWDRPQPGTWLDARQAWYVLDSGKTGGMGAPEPVPFGSEGAARAFAELHGGYLLRFAEIPGEAVLGAVHGAPGNAHARHPAHGHDARNALEGRR